MPAQLKWVGSEEGPGLAKLGSEAISEKIPAATQDISMAKLALQISKFAIALMALSSLVSGSQAQASTGLVGPEWTFSNPQIINADRAGVYESQASEDLTDHTIARWLALIQQQCPKCVIHDRQVHLGGYWFQFDVDPMVIEITAMPTTTSDLREPRRHAQLQQLIWNTGHQIGLAPQERIGGGHLHLDIDTHFHGDAFLFRNFIVDLANRPELFLGGLGLDLLNAPPLAALGPESIDAFEKVISDFDQHPTDIATLRRRIRTEVYRHTPVMGRGAKTEKFQAVNLSHGETIEIRGLRPQTSLAHFIRIAELFEARIEKLEKLTHPIRFEKRDLSRSFIVREDRDIHTYEVLLDPEHVHKSTIEFILASGLNPQDYAHDITPELKTDILTASPKTFAPSMQES